jgi:alpha/beta superfamily hydrolase
MKSYGKIFFSHGKESGPRGFKIQRLSAAAKAAGYHTVSIDHRGITDPYERISKLLRFIENEDQDNIILAGSSMGAFVSIIASESINPAGLFLMAPAVNMEGYNYPEMNPKAKHIEVLHGWKDEIVPVENVYKFCSKHSLNLKILNDRHNLQDRIAV